MATEWVFQPRNDVLQRELSAHLGIGPITAQVLINRGIATPAEARTFLSPDLTDLYEPGLLPDMDAAVQTIVRHIRRGSRILLYGDYDVDGMCALSVLKQFLRLAGSEARTYIPERATEGYGVHLEAIQRFKTEEVDLIITVDCGVASVKEAAEARRLGMELVITDHHEPGTERPDAAAVIDPKLESSTYPFKELAGVGVAFKLAWALAQELSPGRRAKPIFKDFLLDAMGLVALGTIADVVPLLDENRVLARFGLQALRYSQLPGIQALLAQTRLIDARLDTDDISFRLAPRLNVAGRMGDADLALQLLNTDNQGEAERIAAQLEGLNRERQKIQGEIIESARERIARELKPGQKIIILADETWNAGIIGIVASHLVEEFYRPTILFNLDGDLGRGSARSIPGLNIVEILSKCRCPLLSYGGHSQAAGLRIERQHLDRFRQELCELTDQVLVEEDLRPKLEVDAEVTLSLLDAPTVAELWRLAPFGQSAPPPLLAARQVRIGAPRRVGASGRHLSFYAGQGDCAIRAIAFGMGPVAEDLLPRTSRVCDLAFVPKINNWQGRENVELEVKDIRLEDPSES